VPDRIYCISAVLHPALLFLPPSILSIEFIHYLAYLYILCIVLLHIQLVHQWFIVSARRPAAPLSIARRTSPVRRAADYTSPVLQGVVATSSQGRP
jgi:hypothetical protein